MIDMEQVDREFWRKRLNETICTVRFTKVNGEERTMQCTLNQTLIPAVEGEKSTKEKKENPDVQAVWDVEAQGWRSFRWGSVIELRTPASL